MNELKTNNLCTGSYDFKSYFIENNDKICQKKPLKKIFFQAKKNVLDIISRFWKKILKMTLIRNMRCFKTNKMIILWHDIKSYFTEKNGKICQKTPLSKKSCRIKKKVYCHYLLILKKYFRNQLEEKMRANRANKMRYERVSTKAIFMGFYPN